MTENNQTTVLEFAIILKFSVNLLFFVFILNSLRFAMHDFALNFNCDYLQSWKNVVYEPRLLR